MRTMLLNCAAAALMTTCGVAYAQPSSGNTSGQDARNASTPGHHESSRNSRSGNESNSPNESGQSSRSDQSQSNQQCPEGYVMLQEDTVYLMANEPQQHLLQAHLDLAHRDFRKAAGEIRLAAGYLDMQAARNRGQNDQDSKDLKQQADNLRQLAKQLSHQSGQNLQANASGQQNSSEQNSSKSQKQASGHEQMSIAQLDDDFARASQALAKHFDSHAQLELQKKHYLAAGYDLDAAANSFKSTIEWAGQQPNSENVTMINNAEEIAANLRDNDISAASQANSSEKSGQNSSAQSNSGQQNSSQSGVPNNPLNGTTPAEAHNDIQHADKMVSALQKAIDQYDSKIGQENGAQTAGAHQKGAASSSKASNSSNSQENSTNSNASKSNSGKSQ